MCCIIQNLDISYNFWHAMARKDIGCVCTFELWFMNDIEFKALILSQDRFKYDYCREDLARLFIREWFDCFTLLTIVIHSTPSIRILKWYETWIKIIFVIFQSYSVLSKLKMIKQMYLSRERFAFLVCSKYLKWKRQSPASQKRI